MLTCINEILHGSKLSSPSISVLCGAFAVAFCPNASLSEEVTTVHLYESYGTYKLDAPPPEMRPVVLAIPPAFLYGSSASTTTRAWGVNLLSYYPAFTSPKDPENAAFGLACAGICNGRILISIANRTHSITPGSLNMGNFIARAQLKWWEPPFKAPNEHTTKLVPVEPFDEGFERILLNPNGTVGQVDRIYVHRSEIEGQYDLTATCAVNSSRTTCTLHFSLTCNPIVYVSIHGIDGSYLSRSADIREKADRFVSAMVRDPFCKV